MKHLDNVSWKRLVPSIVAGALISIITFAQQSAPTKGTDSDLNNGRKLYVQHCQYCHGEDGDRVDCMEIVPLAGLGRRPRVDLVGQVQSRSYLLRGYSYQGADARDMAAFLLSLKGEKEFGDPGLRCPLPRPQP